MSQGNQGRVVVWGVLGWLCLLNVSVWGQFSGGSGDPNDPYLISDPNDLQAIGLDTAHWDKHFKLVGDLDMTGVALTPIGNPGAFFTGTFNGNDYTVARITIDSPASSYVGLFGYVDHAVDPNTPNTIFNLGLIESDITGKDQVGVLVGYLKNGTVSVTYSSGQVTGTGLNAGGLVGFNNDTINDSYSSAQVSGSNQVGGLVGYSSGTISQCTAGGDVSGTTYIGGLVGWIQTSAIINCYALGAVSGTGNFIGGLAGFNSSGTIDTSHCIGAVSGTGSNVGGLLGFNSAGTVSSSFWDTQTSGQGSSDGGTGQTTEQMKMITTFTDAGWDFLGESANGTEDIWWMCVTPRLSWEVPGIGYGGGNGSIADPYLISDANQLETLSVVSCHWDKQFRLTEDLDMTGAAMVPIGTLGTPFTGIFGGDGFAIANLTINLPATDYVGLFGVVDNTVDPNTINRIFDLGLINPNIIGEDYVGGLAGWLDHGTVSGCYTDGGTINGGNYVGGLVGINGNGTILESYGTGAVSGVSLVGGLVGFNESSDTIGKCYATGAVDGKERVGGLVGDNKGTILESYGTGAVDGEERVGGLVGDNKGTILESYGAGAVSGVSLVGGLVGFNESSDTIGKCYAAGAVSGTSDVGGLVGENKGTILKSYALGTVTGTGNFVGGLVGSNTNTGTISDCYAAGAVTGAIDVGGLVGNNDPNSTISTSYAAGAVSGTSDVGGLVGDNVFGTIIDSFWDTQMSGQASSDGGTGQTTEQMKMLATFTGVGWDFVAVWAIGDQQSNQGYPYLLGKLLSDLNYDGVVNMLDFVIMSLQWLEEI